MGGKGMDITCLIPTRGERPGGMDRAIASIPPSVRIRVLRNETGWLWAVNAACATVPDAMLLSGDDMVYRAGAVEAAVEEMAARFPDGDGVIGFNQANLGSFCEGGFTLVGAAFIRRFPGRRLFCPDYKHYFADTELWNYARETGAFFYCERAKVDHYHFSVTGEQDATTLVSRSHYQDDRLMSHRRAAKGWLWGRDFNLAGEI